MPLLLLWVVRPVQSLSACTRVHFTFTFTYLDRDKQNINKYFNPIKLILTEEENIKL